MKRLLIGVFCLALALDSANAALRFGLGNAVAKRSADLVNKAGEENHFNVGENAAASLPSCSAAPFYTVSPSDPADITGIVPLGNLNPSGHTFPSDHIYPYLQPVDPAQPVGTRVVTNLYAPADITVTDVAPTDYPNALTPFTDYAIYFYACRDVKSYYSHVRTLSPELAAKLAAFSLPTCSTYSTGGGTFHRCDFQTNFTMKAGDLMGTAGGTAASYDFGTYDYRTTLTGWANSSRHLYDQAHTVCPLDYFVPSVAQPLKDKLGEFNGSTLRTIPPVCGTTMQDVPGTAQGYWYKPGQPDVPEDPHLALMHSYVNPTYGVVSSGTSVAGMMGTWYFTPTTSGLVRRDFNQITDNQIYCYDQFRDPLFALTGNPTIILVQLTAPTTLTIEKQSATDCSAGSWSFTSNAVTFQR
jgi:hypothetical protein